MVLQFCLTRTILLDQGCYIASESSFYRVMKKYNQAAHRGRSKLSTKCPVSTHKTTGSNQVWMWDITWLPGPAKGVYYYLYMIMDLYSRKIVGWEVWKNESSEKTSKLVRKAVYSENILLKKEPLVLNSDNGSPMKGASLLATLYRLGIVFSKSRPRVSNDNPYIESLFRTAKYMPVFPHKGFEMLNKAREWVHTFVQYYNSKHRHSSLKFVTPDQRHTGEDIEILKRRKEICEKTKVQTPERWSGNTRNWDLEDEIWLNPVTKRQESNVI